MTPFYFLVRAYNAEKTISETLLSIWASTDRRDVYVLVLDDCSADETANVARNVMTRHDISGQVIVQPQRVGSLLNTFMGLMWIKDMDALVACIDGDDTICNPQTVEFMRAAFRETGCWVLNTDQVSSTGWKRMNYPNAVAVPFVRNVTWTEPCPPLSHMRVARRWFWDLIDWGAEPEHFEVEDCVIMFSMYEMAAPDKVRYFNRPLYWYRVNEQADQDRGGKMVGAANSVLRFPPKVNISAKPCPKPEVTFVWYKALAEVVGSDVMLVHGIPKEAKTLKAAGVHHVQGFHPDPRYQSDQIYNTSLYTLERISTPLVLMNVLDAVSWHVPTVARFLDRCLAMAPMVVVMQQFPGTMDRWRDQRIDLRHHLIDVFSQVNCHGEVQVTGSIGQPGERSGILTDPSSNQCTIYALHRK